MSRMIFDHGLQLAQFNSGVIRVLLEAHTSTYLPDRSHQYLSQFFANGGVELSEPASYARQTLTGKTAAADVVKHQFELDANDVAFGTLEISSQRIISAMYYIEVGGDDSTPADDVLWMRDDGKIDIKLTAAASLSDTTLYVEPIAADLRDGTTIEFSGGGTCTLDGDHSKGDDTLSVSALATSAAARWEVASDVDTVAIIPGLDCIAVPQNGPVNIAFDPDGLVYFKQR
ncbi:hypothetical protein ACYFX5_09215 [Bremerella sp. T1]|uniref:hypothetical protein n=1 Tax=Bremerella sp. TYQ1 TaxID=3119568 RepID=UPI001CCAB628|nr:hypothetical protein [Bremerella volcania]UBM38432.1 hypothetical protein LA756_11150 [Bremerella volcania]